MLTQNFVSLCGIFLGVEWAGIPGAEAVVNQGNQRSPRKSAQYQVIERYDPPTEQQLAPREDANRQTTPKPFHNIGTPERTQEVRVQTIVHPASFSYLSTNINGNGVVSPPPHSHYMNQTIVSPIRRSSEDSRHVLDAFLAGNRAEFGLRTNQKIRAPPTKHDYFGLRPPPEPLQRQLTRDFAPKSVLNPPVPESPPRHGPSRQQNIHQKPSKPSSKYQQKSHFHQRTKTPDLPFRHKHQPQSDILDNATTPVLESVQSLKRLVSTQLPPSVRTKAIVFSLPKAEEERKKKIKSLPQESGEDEEEEDDEKVKDEQEEENDEIAEESEENDSVEKEDLKSSATGKKKSESGGSEFEEDEETHASSKGGKVHKKESKEEKKEKGKNAKESHEGDYHEEKGGKKKYKKGDSFHTKHEKSEKTKKGKKHGEGKKRKKGHSTHGEHNIVKKDEFIKSTKFYDEEDDDEEQREHEELEDEHEKEDGHSEEGKKYNEGHESDDKSKKGHHSKGHHVKDYAAHGNEEEEESYESADEKKTKKSGKASKKKWG